MTKDEKRRRRIDRQLDWLEEFFSSWRLHEGRTIYNRSDRKAAKADYEAMRKTIAEGKR